MKFRTHFAHVPKPKTEHLRVRNRYMNDAHRRQPLDVTTTHVWLIPNLFSHCIGCIEMDF